jgi:hypothetical protein
MMVNVAGHGGDYSRKYCSRLPGYPSNPIVLKAYCVKPITLIGALFGSINGQYMVLLAIDFSYG